MECWKLLTGAIFPLLREGDWKPEMFSVCLWPQSQLVAVTLELCSWWASPSAKPPRSLHKQMNPFLGDSSYLLVHQTGISFFLTFLFSPFPNVHHSDSHIKIRSQMPFLGLHPGPFIPKGAREQLSHFLPDWGKSSPHSPIASGFLRATRGHGGWQGRACGISADEEISQIASRAVNTNDSQQGGITETDASSSRSQGLQKGLTAGAHSSPFAWLRKSTAW